MHDLEPHWGWRDYYTAEDDPQSPFYEREYSEFFFTDQIYNYVIHPQWDNIGSPTLFIKILYSDYEEGVSVIELIGEWNDALHNDVHILKRDIIEPLMYEGISQFIFMSDNLLTFHSDISDYYEEWFEEVSDQDGFIAMVNMQEHVQQEFREAELDSYLIFGNFLSVPEWRVLKPQHFIEKIKMKLQNLLGSYTPL